MNISQLNIPVKPKSLPGAPKSGGFIGKVVAKSGNRVQVAIEDKVYKIEPGNASQIKVGDKIQVFFGNEMKNQLPPEALKRISARLLDIYSLSLPFQATKELEQIINNMPQQERLQFASIANELNEITSQILRDDFSMELKSMLENGKNPFDLYDSRLPFNSRLVELSLKIKTMGELWEKLPDTIKKDIIKNFVLHDLKEHVSSTLSGKSISADKQVPVETDIMKEQPSAEGMNEKKLTQIIKTLTDSSKLTKNETNLLKEIMGKIGQDSTKQEKPLQNLDSERNRTNPKSVRNAGGFEKAFKNFSGRNDKIIGDLVKKLDVNTKSVTLSKVEVDFVKNLIASLNKAIESKNQEVSNRLEQMSAKENHQLLSDSEKAVYKTLITKLSQAHSNLKITSDEASVLKKILNSLDAINFNQSRPNKLVYIDKGTTPNNQNQNVLINKNGVATTQREQEIPTTNIGRGSENSSFVKSNGKTFNIPLTNEQRETLNNLYEKMGFKELNHSNPENSRNIGQLLKHLGINNYNNMSDKALAYNKDITTQLKEMLQTLLSKPGEMQNVMKELDRTTLQKLFSSQSGKTAENRIAELINNPKIDNRTKNILTAMKDIISTKSQNLTETATKGENDAILKTLQFSNVKQLPLVKMENSNFTSQLQKLGISQQDAERIANDIVNLTSKTLKEPKLANVLFPTTMKKYLNQEIPRLAIQQSQGGEKNNEQAMNLINRFSQKMFMMLRGELMKAGYSRQSQIQNQAETMGKTLLNNMERPTQDNTTSGQKAAEYKQVSEQGARNTQTQSTGSTKTSNALEQSASSQTNIPKADIMSADRLLKLLNFSSEKNDFNPVFSTVINFNEQHFSVNMQKNDVETKGYNKEDMYRVLIETNTQRFGTVYVDTVAMNKNLDIYLYAGKEYTKEFTNHSSALINRIKEAGFSVRSLLIRDKVEHNDILKTKAELMQKKEEKKGFFKLA